MSRHDDPSYDPSAFRVLPHISQRDHDLIRLAFTLADQMHPLNADQKLAEVQTVLRGVSGDNTADYVAGVLRYATDGRDAMKGMGEGRIARGLHPVPEHLRHLLQPGEADARQPAGEDRE